MKSIVDEVDQETWDRLNEKIVDSFTEMGEKIAQVSQKLADTMNDSLIGLKRMPAPDENPMNVPKSTIMKRRRKNKAARKARRRNR